MGFKLGKFAIIEAEGSLIHQITQLHEQNCVQLHSLEAHNCKFSQK